MIIRSDGTIESVKVMFGSGFRLSRKWWFLRGRNKIRGTMDTVFEKESVNLSVVSYMQLYDIRFIISTTFW